MQRTCNNAFDLFLLAKNIPQNKTEVLIKFDDFYKSQDVPASMERFLASPEFEKAYEIDENMRLALEDADPYLREINLMRTKLDNQELLNQNSAKLLLHMYAEYLNISDYLTQEFSRLKKETKNKFYRSHSMPVAYDSAKRTFTLVLKKTGRPLISKPRTRTTVRIANSIFDDLKSYCQTHNLSQVECIELALTKFLHPDMKQRQNSAVENSDKILSLMKDKYNSTVNMDALILSEHLRQQYILAKKPKTKE